jgi:hypothetical protein
MGRNDRSRWDLPAIQFLGRADDPSHPTSKYPLRALSTVHSPTGLTAHINREAPKNWTPLDQGTTQVVQWANFSTMAGDQSHGSCYVTVGWRAVLVMQWRNQSHRHQHQHEKEEGVCPVSRIWAACSSVLAASWSRLASAASLFASARWLTAASLLASLSCSRARFRSILACDQRGSFCQILQVELLLNCLWIHASNSWAFLFPLRKRASLTCFVKRGVEKGTS